MQLGHELNYVKTVLFSRCLCTSEGGGEYTKGFCVSDMDRMECVDLHSEEFAYHL